MFLKQIKIYGFKSFADKLDIDLCPNINGIVGPNGSGKSNIIDAVRWVLGEQSIKSLRGESSSDIIFSGSKNRKPLNSAYVTLIFDNSDRGLPIDYNEVSVKRVMYRTGENEYFLNQERCRLKDITDLLVDTGASKESFHIISQGKIDEILSAKPTDRRGIFESAAGVSKYKKRKEEAIRKLDRTNANLDRVNDIIRELESNLSPLEIQSRDARKYLDWQEELKNIEISLIIYDIENYSYRVRVDRESLDQLNDEIARLSSNNSSYDVDLLKYRNRLKEVDENINKNQNEFLSITQKIEAIDADIRVLKERKKYVRSSDETLGTLSKLKEEEFSLSENLHSINNQLLLEKKRLEERREFFGQEDSRLLHLKNKKNELEKEIGQNNRLITDIGYKIEYLENSIRQNSNMPNSVKSILNHPRFTFVHNTIGRLIEVEDQYRTCLETALGGASSYLVVDTSENAKELVNYLKEHHLGRATFFPMDVIRQRSLDFDSLSKIKEVPSYVNTLDQLVSYDQKYANIIKNQLGNVIVATDISGANYLSKLIHHKYKIVTLDGQVVHVGGSVTGGSKIRENNSLREKYELDENKKKLETCQIKSETLSKSIRDLDDEIHSLEEKHYHHKVEEKEIEFNVEKINKEKDHILESLGRVQNEIKDLNSISNFTTDEEENQLLESYYQAKISKDNILTLMNELKLEKETIEFHIHELEELSKKSNSGIYAKQKKAGELEVSLNTMNMNIDHLLLNLSEDYNMTFEHAKERFKLEIEESVAREKVLELKNNIRNIGYVNVGAIEEYERVKSRYDFLNSQRDDLRGAEDTLLEIIKEMDEVMTSKFLSTFEEIRREFKKVFRQMFGGGDAELTLTDPQHILETGIDIKAVPSGKTMKSLSLLSGGEKTFTAISLLFAILNIRPVPFCLLDEVEAALDDANVESFGNYLYKYRNKTQFILVTHKKKTMEFADVLYGITMQESGVSKLVSVKLEDINNNKESS